MELLKQIEQLKIMPVIKSDSAENAAPPADAPIRGGLPAAEVTFRTDAAEDASRIMVKNHPEICTPTEPVLLLEYGLPAAKFFPAEQYGGLKTIKALSAPFPNIRFMPTGGSWMVKDSLINNHEFDEIAKLTKEAVSLVKKEA